MLASPATVIPDGDDWIHEVKWDGMRVLADVRDGVLTLTSRVGNDVTAS
jgi:bifunctional non-homologous end joining protein LigD